MVPTYFGQCDASLFWLEMQVQEHETGTFLILFPSIHLSLSLGSQSRVILCVERHTDEEVPERKCDSAAKPVPEEEPCNTHPCPPL